MGNYKIKMNIGIYNEEDGLADGVVAVSDGCIPESLETSIDAVEKILLTVNKEVLKKSVSGYLETISKKKTELEQNKNGGEIITNEKQYSVDGEIGRFSFNTHTLVNEDKPIFNTSKDIFRTLRDREYYRTEGFNELLFPLVTNESYRHAEEKLNRIRREGEGGTPMRTLAGIVESESTKINKNIDEKVETILVNHKFSSDGHPIKPNAKYGESNEQMFIDKTDVKKAQERYNNNVTNELKIEDVHCEKNYADKTESTNIPVDDVGVKKQVEHRLINEQKELKYVRNTIVHVENNDKQYYLNSGSTVSAMPVLLAFLLNNRLINTFIEFFVDGERSLQQTIIDHFSFHQSFNMILDWYHLKKKCELELSLALKNKDFRNNALSEITKYLWVGDVSGAIKIITNIDPVNIKSQANADRLVTYFERNLEYIPCYALRKELGLRNSSNRGEKANDLVVAERQKHNGMSWSKDGSVGLATISALALNDELHNWFSSGNVDFQLVS